ncbi:hypothetical protein ACRAWF_04695 [Streptomyces sp. L7]
MSAFHEEFDVDCRPEDAWAYVIDPSHLPDWQESAVSAEQLDDRPFGLGSPGPRHPARGSPRHGDDHGVHRVPATALLDRARDRRAPSGATSAARSHRSTTAAVAG